MDGIKLTIGIPTYNRNITLNESLIHIFPQISNNKNIELLIIDNCSDEPVIDSISHAFSDLPDNLRVIRNRYNVGANDNILRVIEHSNGDFVYVLGDDDHVLPNAINIILVAIEKHNNAWFINFNTPLPGHIVRTKESVFSNLGSFIDGIDSFGQIMFISDGVYNVDKLRLGLRFGHFYQNTCAPGFVTLLYAMRQNNDSGQVVLTNQRIIDITTTAAIETQMSIIPVIQGLTFLAELDLPKNLSLALRKAISTTQNEWLTYKGFVRSLVYELHQGQPRFRILFMHNSIVRRFFFLDRCKMKLFGRYMFSLFLMSKSLTRLMLSIASKLTGRQFTLNDEHRNRC